MVGKEQGSQANLDYMLVHSNYSPGSAGGVEQVVAGLLDIVNELGIDSVCVYGGSHSELFVNRVKPSITRHSRHILFKLAGCPFLHLGNRVFLRHGLRARLIIFQEPFPSLWPALLLLNWVFRKQIVVLVHAIPASNPIVSLLYTICRSIVFRGCKFVTTSPQLQARLEGVMSKGKADVIPLAIPDLIVDDQITDHPIKGKYMLYFGRLADYKGIPTLLATIRLLPDVSFVIAGDGKYSEFISKSIDEDGLENLTFIGRECSEDEKNELIANCHGLIFPSISVNEAFGLVQLEAMRAGKAIINTRLDTGVNFVAPDNICALTVQPKSVTELRNAVRLLWDCEKLSMFLGAQGRSRFEDQFTESRFKSAWRDLLNSEA